MGESVKAKYFTYSGKTYDKISNVDLEGGLQKAVKERRMPKFCTACHGPLTYKGLGEFECGKCNKEYLTNYGRIRRVLDINGAMTIQELLEETGLSKEDIKELVDDGSLSVVGGRINFIR